MKEKMEREAMVVEEAGVETPTMSGGGAAPALAPVAADPEVSTRGIRRRFSAAYKRRILQEADKCDSGELGALLRREESLIVSFDAVAGRRLVFHRLDQWGNQIFRYFICPGSSDKPGHHDNWHKHS